MKELKIENMQISNATNAKANNTKIKEEIENTSEDTTKPTAKSNKEAIVKHVVTYMGNGVFEDTAGYKWHKHTEKTYSDEEYSARSDLHFMVNYGEMNHTIVTI